MTLLQKHRSPGQLNIARILLFSVSSTKQFLLLKPAWTTGASNQNSSLMCAHRWPLRYVSSHLTRFQCHSEQPLLPLLSAVSECLPKRTYYCILSFCCQELPLLPAEKIAKIAGNLHFVWFYIHSGCPSKVGQPECSDFI